MQVLCWGGAEGGRLPQAVSRGRARAQVRTPQPLRGLHGGPCARQDLDGTVPAAPLARGTHSGLPHCRESQVLSVRGESIPEERFCRSLCRAVSMWPGARLVDYVCVESALLGESPASCPSPPERVARATQGSASPLVPGRAVGGFNVLAVLLQVLLRGPLPPTTKCSWSCGACGTCRRGSATR